MIAIINQGSENCQEPNDPGGERNYDLKINQQSIARFKHFRRDGLAACLRKAAEAVEDAEKKEKEKLTAFIESYETEVVLEALRKRSQSGV